MSIFLNNLTTQGKVDEEKIKLAETQFDAMCTTFNNILNICLEKCISHDQYSENDLTKGEICCIDRCVKKVHYSNRLIGGYLQANGLTTPDKFLPHINSSINTTNKDNNNNNNNNINIRDPLPKTFQYNKE